ncbi:peptidoglycan D,D-transpeptidase FtsI family protein [Candidatus Nitrospira inopinata]|uniref:Peptidoglycan glycosyltransferase n=1 Tax=Candidatus Nitrospira inopinata TaxID=1715989 RepID=A0A0S4KQ27_9BACT|nr:penicillin-binding protein 2 [Candidatus Nitrospira inopinata]CUQ65278.1 Peptidoglycan glycosyltransferase [Candidatus Nitrospira inopinata]
MAAPLSRGRRFFTILLLLSGFGVVLSRLVTLQVLQAAELTAKADRQHQTTVSVEGVRGAIVDRHGKVLAMNLEVPSVYGVPTVLDSPARTARELAPLLHVRSEDLERKLRQPRGFVWLARKVDPDRRHLVERVSSMEGVGVKMEGRRFYPKGPLLSHVLGFAGMDGEGLEGIERRYEKELRGEKRAIVLQKDARGRAVFPKGLSEEPAPAPGHQLVLTIDEVIQYIVEKELEEAVARSRAKSGTAIVLDPGSGALLALAVSPRFNPNAIAGLEPDRWRNRAVADAYEPGSTMKAILAAAAIEEGVMTPTTLVYGEQGRLAVSNTVIHDHEKLGWMSFAQVVQKSSNVGAAKVGMALGEERLYRYFRAFGFGERTEIDLPGETAGLLKNPKEWGKRTAASVSMGQEIGVTPIQMVSAMAAIANGGILMKPYVVSEIRDAHGLVIKRVLPSAKRRVISPETARTVTSILEGVVTDGTGGKAAIEGFRVAGKTGTAQKIDRRTRTYSTTKFVSSFAGYVPAENPKLAMIVVIDEPNGEAWGGTVAAPVFRRVGEQVLKYWGISSNEPVRLAMATARR